VIARLRGKNSIAEECRKVITMPASQKTDEELAKELIDIALDETPLTGSEPRYHPNHNVY
jgi:hypothetical protein